MIYDFDAYAFSSSTNDVNGVKFTALYTLQHGLPRHTQSVHKIDLVEIA